MIGEPLLAQENVLRVYTQVRNAANIDYDENGDPVPVDIGSQLLHAMLAETELEYSIEIAPWARIIQYLDSRPNILAYTLVRTEEREEQFHWIGLVNNIESYLYGLSERAAELPRTIEAARAYQVGSIRGDAYDNLLTSLEFSNIVHINNGAPWLTLLERGRLDLVPFGEQALSEYLEQQQIHEERLVPLVRLEALSTGLYFAASKQTDPELIAQLRDAYRAMVLRGDYEEVMGVPHPDILP